MSRVYKNPGPLTFMGIIQQQAGSSNSGSWIAFPYDLKETYGVGNLIPFKAVFDNHVTYQGSLAKMGGPQAMILLRKDIRAKLGKGLGDVITVRVELDDTPRAVSLPQDLAKQLGDAELLSFWEGLAFTHRREYVQWIEGAKRPETREGRIAKTIATLTAKKERR